MRFLIPGTTVPYGPRSSGAVYELAPGETGVLARMMLTAADDGLTPATSTRFGYVWAAVRTFAWVAVVVGVWAWFTTGQFVGAIWLMFLLGCLSSTVHAAVASNATETLKPVFGCSPEQDACDRLAGAMRVAAAAGLLTRRAGQRQWTTRYATVRRALCREYRRRTSLSEPVGLSTRRAVQDADAFIASVNDAADRAGLDSRVPDTIPRDWAA